MSPEAGDWRPAADWPTLAARAALLAAARSWFAAREITEVETPALGAHGVTDVNIASVCARLGATPGRDWYLHSSPEYCMKRLLAAGAPDIYQICRVYRDGESGRHHQPEFTMIEWYRHGFGLPEIVADTCSLLAALLATGRGQLSSETVRYTDAFRRATGLDPLRADTRTLRAAAADAGGVGLADAGRDACLDLLMGLRVSPSLGRERLTAVTHYPASQAALACIDPDEHRVALRFEVFLDGRELANGFVELADAAEQRARFEADRAERRRRGLPDVVPDERLLAALSHGLPPAAGVAVGFDRVVMAATRREHIREVQSFVVLD